jgi:hypothetical protein
MVYGAFFRAPLQWRSAAFGVPFCILLSAEYRTPAKYTRPLSSQQLKIVSMLPDN